MARALRSKYGNHCDTRGADATVTAGQIRALAAAVQELPDGHELFLTTVRQKVRPGLAGIILEDWVGAKGCKPVLEKEIPLECAAVLVWGD
jgi:hypothetical protein